MSLTLTIADLSVTLTKFGDRTLPRRAAEENPVTYSSVGTPIIEGAPTSPEEWNVKAFCPQADYQKLLCIWFESDYRRKNQAKRVTAINATTNRLTITGHKLVDGDRLFTPDSGTLPAPLVNATAYYAKVIDSNTIELYTTAALSTVIDMVGTTAFTLYAEFGILAYDLTQYYAEHYPRTRAIAPDTTEVLIPDAIAPTHVLYYPQWSVWMTARPEWEKINRSDWGASFRMQELEAIGA